MLHRPPALKALPVEIRMVVALMARKEICRTIPSRNGQSSLGLEHRSHGGIPIL